MKYFLLFETLRKDRENRRDFFFSDPVDVIKVHDYRQVQGAFKKIDSYSAGHYLGGYFSYELGYYFELPSFSVPRKFSYPLIHVAVFKKPAPLSRKSRILGSKESGYRLRNLRFNYKEPDYTGKIRSIKEYIRRGQTYQVNFTGKYYFDFYGSPFCLYEELKKRQEVSYASFCRLGSEFIISLSPELFFRREGERIISRPMKGTFRRGRDISEDRENILRLSEGPKNRAENLMIVDLIRNDLGRICRPESVKASRMFEVEKYNTLFQMTSTVSGRLQRGITYFDIFRNIFPGGSVTGAPKIRTMQIIRKLEKGSRDIYCGALGLISPGGKAVFNMPIRTISISGNKGRMGVGSGIVIDSDSRQEYRECLLKADFLTRKAGDFRLIETMLWDRGYKFLKEHLRRLEGSASYFDFSFSRQEILSSLKRLAEKFAGGKKYRVRLLLNKAGCADLEYSELVCGNMERPVIISKYKVDPDDVFLYHKTTNRLLYDSEYRIFSKKGYFDVLFFNNRNELSEGAISNIVLQKHNRLYTPPVSSGLLPGIFRQHLLDTGRAVEKKLAMRDLRQADKLFVCNSVRGLVEVKPDSPKWKNG